LIFLHFYAGRPPDEQTGVRDGRWKLVVSEVTGEKELFDLDKDPGEQINLIEEHKDLAEQLLNRLEMWKPHSRNLIENYSQILQEHGRRCP